MAVDTIMRTRRRVLIVEDDPLIAWALTDMVKELGYDALGPVATESAAVDVTQRLLPDAVIMDVRLAAGGSGLSAAQQIRRLPGVARFLPIVFCTAFAGELQSNEEMLNVERSKLLAKPVFREKLEHVLEQALTSP